METPRLVLTEKDLGNSQEALKPLVHLDLAEALREGEAKREAAPQGAWTMRLAVSGRSDGHKIIARAAGPKAAEIMMLPYVRSDGLRTWQACFGIYPSRVLAKKAWKKAPETLRRAFKDALPQELSTQSASPPRIQP